MAMRGEDLIINIAQLIFQDGSESSNQQIALFNELQIQFIQNDVFDKLVSDGAVADLAKENPLFELDTIGGYNDGDFLFS